MNAVLQPRVERWGEAMVFDRRGEEETLENAQRLARQAGNPGRVWALLLHHLHTEQQLALADAALGLVERELASLPASLRQSLHAQLLAAAPGQRAAGSTRQAA